VGGVDVGEVAEEEVGWGLGDGEFGGHCGWIDGWWMGGGKEGWKGMRASESSNKMTLVDILTATCSCWEKLLPMLAVELLSAGEVICLLSNMQIHEAPSTKQLPPWDSCIHMLGMFVRGSCSTELTKETKILTISYVSTVSQHCAMYVLCVA
jgi:hypothetical protein